jgi:hypothetical protein
MCVLPMAFCWCDGSAEQQQQVGPRNGKRRFASSHMSRRDDCDDADVVC